MSGIGAFASGMAGGINSMQEIKQRKEETDLLRDMTKQNMQARRDAVRAPEGGPDGSGASGAPRSMRQGSVSPAPRYEGDMPVDFAAYEARYDLPEGFLARTAQLESSMGKNMKNPNSSAEGPFQFIDSTAQRYGLKNRRDWGQSTDAASRLGRDNASALSRALGRAPTGAELYLAHQQGAGGATKLLSNPDARAVDVVGVDAVRLNGGSEDMTAKDFANIWLGKFGDPAPSRTRRAAAPTPTPEMPEDPPRARTMRAFQNLNR